MPVAAAAAVAAPTAAVAAAPAVATAAALAPAIPEEECVSALERLVDPPIRTVRKIEDAPLGIRLINSYKLARSDRTLRIPIRPRKGDSSAISKGEGKKKSSYSVPIDGPIRQWQKISRLGVQAVLPLHSVSAVAEHQGTETLYGVAFTSMNSKSDKDKMTSLVSGVTLLPPGGLWLSLALSCIDHSPEAIISFETNKFNKEKQSEECATEDVKNISNYDFSSCYAVQKCLRESSTQTIERNDILTGLVDKIFKTWTDSNQ